MIWKKFTVETTEEAEDLVSAFLNEHGAEGVLIENAAPPTEEELRQMYVDIPLPEKADDGSSCVSCFLKPEADIQGLRRDMRAELKRLSAFLPVGTGRITVSDTTDDTTWQDNYKKYFKPFRLYDKIIVEPVWEEYPDKRPEDKVIRIDSVMAFGTGTHETTRLCIGNLLKYLKPGASVFDIGCGSGILSIAAAKLGAGYVHGMDIDPQAVKSSYKNAAASGYTHGEIGFTCGNLLDRNYITDAGTGDGGSIAPLTPGDYGKPDEADTSRKYDIAVANILAEVIIPLSAKVPAHLKPGGIFITSGISAGKEERVKKAMTENGFRILDVTRENDWISVVGQI